MQYIVIVMWEGWSLETWFNTMYFAGKPVTRENIKLCSAVMLEQVQRND